MATPAFGEHLRRFEEAVRRAHEALWGGARLVHPTSIEFSAPVSSGPRIVDVMVDDLGVPPASSIRNVGRGFRRRQ
ncbi:MAG: hypothetical protein U1E23_14870 [Reyranellaceae bacterium]